jgi:hypothetical protein
LATGSDAQQAFERGDFHRARELSRELVKSGDDATRAAGDLILKRTSLDPFIVYVTGGCVAFFVLVVVLALH